MRNRNETPKQLTLKSSRDDMHEDLLECVRFNRFDMRFMANIYNKYIAKARPLSVNQNDVYEKIIHKYKKQLKRLGVRHRDILELQWCNGIATQEEIMKKTFFRFVEKDGNVQIEMYFPFNETLKQEIQSIVGDDACEYLNIEARSRWDSPGRRFDFRWYPEEKKYRGTYNTFLFRKLYDFAVRNNINIDSYVQGIVDRLNDYGPRENWAPCVHVEGTKLVVTHPAPSMADYLSKIDMGDTSAKNIERICKLGIQPPKEVDDIADFIAPDAANGVHVGSSADLERLYEYLRRTDRKAIWIKPNTLSSSKAQSSIYKELNDQTVSLFENLNWDSPIIHIERARYTPDFIDDMQSKVDMAKEKGYNTVILTSDINEVLRSQSFVGKIVMDADKILYLLLPG